MPVVAEAVWEQGSEVNHSPSAICAGSSVSSPRNPETDTPSSLTAFYQGDATYTESVSAGLPITISNYALSSPGVTAPLGSAAIAPVIATAFMVHIFESIRRKEASG